MDLRDELRASAREVLGGGSDWPRLVDAGWPGLEVPDDVGGAGVSFVETAVVLEELGRAAAPSGLLGTALAVGALVAVAADPARDALLGRIADGASAALATGFALDHGAVSGHATFVPDAEGAEVVVLLADDSVVVAEDLVVTGQPVLDETRRLAEVAAGGAAVVQRWALPRGPARLTERAAVAIACDSLGIAEAMLTATVDYVSVRTQFDRPIGSFQAVKHACADMLVQCRLARQLVDAAVTVVAEGGDASRASAMAKSYACTAAVNVTGKAVQLHGGIGYTWESGLHAYLKRAILNRALFDAPATHRRRLAARYG